MNKKPLVELKGVKKRIGKKDIIHGLTFDIYGGEVFGFLGPNGAGKTTTIRMMVGLMSLSGGQILIKGKNIESQYKQAVSEVGAIVENPEMYKFLTGYQNLIHYSRMVKGVSKGRIAEVIELVGLTNRIHEKVKTYSLGMRQRLGLAQALLHSPSVLILDEPTNGLDPAGIREIRYYLRQLAEKEGIAVIVSSHLLSEMELMCDRIAIIQNGKLIGVQSTKEFVESGTERKVRFLVDEIAAARHAVSHHVKSERITLGNGFIEAEMERELIPEVTATLVVEGVKVYGISTETRTLEDKFLEVTGGKEIV
ncbi:ABC-2 type transport system ATP-binding protein [Fictibacillus enclensis]|uniref:Bacitracin ABC transporter ATP-binding protein n=1 Tax=Fictibacillus enclensis TaxID=1017270 RepID=A0A0V8JCE5_9BACL|nr:ABC transporter ATP-binding protein [Fictibacillus enclensis]KSU84653.1 bacitracin ABC transporter ATP-binding protein [Fictibacillus enclensis]WHY73957.1 ABC transporter ATP-binding protein [Fictibacillus enclensis]SCB83096.1 ABC-2 type transport system ATP-binding protein [Fictibacillus enclensis]